MKNFLVIGRGTSGQDCAELIQYIYTSANIYFYDDSSAKNSFKDDADIFKIDYENVIVSPGFAPQSELLVKLFDKYGDRVLSEISFSSQFLKSECCLGVTGSMGKSTFCKMLEHILKQDNKTCFSVGNIGYSLSRYLLSVLKGNVERADFLSIELSSYQLEYGASVFLKQSILLNCVPNHLARHGDMTSYIDAKLNMQKMTQDSFYLTDVAEKQIKLQLKDVVYLILPKGEFTHKNYPQYYNDFWELAHVFLSDYIGQQFFNIDDFNFLEHRFEIFKSAKSIFVNDSKATSIEATRGSIQTALEMFPSTELVVFLGGATKQEDWNSFLKECRSQGLTVVMFGQLAEEYCSQYNFDYFISLNELIEKFKFREENVYLLAPGCASFDEFDNFEKRGDYFKNAILNMINLS